VAVRGGLRARQSLGERLAPPQLGAGEGPLVADLRLHHARGRAGHPVRPAARRGAAAPHRPLARVHQRRGLARLYVHGALRRDSADPLLLRPRDAMASEPQHVTSRRLVRARDTMHRLYADALDIEWLAGSVHLSRAHFIRSFRDTFGETPHRYLQRRRIERAMALLRDSDLSVTDICFDVG